MTIKDQWDCIDRWVVDNKFASVLIAAALALVITQLSFSALPIQLQIILSRVLNEPSVLIDCHESGTPPFIAPGEKMHVLEAVQASRDMRTDVYAPVIFEYLIPNADFKWPKLPSEAPLPGYRCQFTNYNGVDRFNVFLHLNFTFKEPIADSGNPAMKIPGPAILSRDVSIGIPRTSPRADGSNVVYIFNMTEKFAELPLPKSAAEKSNRAINGAPIRFIRPIEKLDFVPMAIYPPAANP